MTLSKITFLFLTMSTIIFIGCQPKIKTWEVQSPDKSVTFTLTHSQLNSARSEISYQIFLTSDSGQVEIIKKSPLGITRSNGNFTNNLNIYSESSIREFTESYSMLTGKVKNVEKAGRQLSVTFQNGKFQLITIEIRAFNQGVAFRYIFNDTTPEPVTITNELTGFHLPVEGHAWMQPYDTVTKWTPAYETYYENKIPIGQSSPKTQGWSFPMLFELEKVWILITESNLGNNYFGSHVQPQAVDGLYLLRLPEKEEAMKTCAAEPTSTLPWTLPWRVFIIGTNPGEIIESTLVNDLADSSLVEDTSWIIPGRASWSWWSDHASPQSFDKQTGFIDLAAKMGWEYYLVDANWNIMKGGNIEKLIEYANKKGVGIWLWYNSGGLHNTVEEMVRNIMDNKDKRREEFKKLQEWGVKGVKVDFFQSDKPDIIKEYLDILSDAEEFNILVNFHGCTLPRGWSRTYPHMLSMESVRGEECYSFDPDFPDKAPWYNTILPFTRNAVGPMDYTPAAFSNQTYPHKTTNAHELALSIIFETGILHFADSPESYLNQPDFVLNHLRTVPVTWNQTKFLEGYPGEYVVLAREKDNVWYFAGINGLDEAKTISLKMPFINEGLYLAEIIGDGKDDRSFVYYKKPFSSEKTIEIEMAPRGGFTGKLLIK